MDHCDYEVSVGDNIVSNTNQYEVQEILGSGAFGVVSLCCKFSTNQTVALKMMRDTEDLSGAEEEEAILQKMMEDRAVDYNIVQWFGSFDFMGHYCRELEPLDMSLLDYFKKYGTLQLKEF